ncbi:hypothetical protein Scep_011937 [Stephania cephalantha]|uniref:Carbohydrate kinase PfkB domain-containing protein n=1 Tax=Stephania cephalantha TaxID=152367 RepID=A0AAP0JEA9_9MAGN
MGVINNSIPITPSNPPHPPKSLTTHLINLNHQSPSPLKPKPQFPTLTVNSSNPQKTTPFIPTPTPPLVVWGSANADIYVEIDRLPRPGETVSARTGQTLSGGKGANQAVCAGKLEYPAVYFVGRVGEDANGRLIAEALVGGGVMVEYLKGVGGGGVPTGHAVVMLQSGGQNSIIIVGGANMEGWAQVLDEGELEVVRNAGIVLLQREIPDYVNIQVAKAARSAGVPVILDAGGMDGLIPVDLLTNVDIFSPNETELERLTGMPTESFEQISQSVVKIHEMLFISGCEGGSGETRKQRICPICRRGGTC